MGEREGREDGGEGGEGRRGGGGGGGWGRSVRMVKPLSKKCPTFRGARPSFGWRWYRVLN